MNNSQPSFHPSPSKPNIVLPPGSCDSHCHVFGPQSVYPFAANRTYTPADAPKEALFELHKLLGFERSVIVHPGCHGFDISVTIDAMAAKNGQYRGVALLPTDVDTREIKRLDDLGFRGVRFSFIRHLGKGAKIEDVIALGNRLADFGWHLQLHMESSYLEELSPWIKRSAVVVVIDHMGRVDASLGQGQSAFQCLLELMQDEKIWVKVSCSERISRQPPAYEDATPFARTLVANFGDRCLWGTDWPHPNFSGPAPDDGNLVDLLESIAPSAAQRQALLVDNPERLFRFDPVSN